MNKRLIVSILLVGTLAAQSTDPQELWSSASAWIRDYLLTTCEGSKGTAQARAQALMAHENIAQSLDPYYNKTVTQEFARLLKEQGQLTLSLIDAAQKNDLRGFNQAQTGWKKNACTLSTFLSKTNPYLSFNATRLLLTEYLTSLVTMITSRLDKRWQDDSTAYNTMRTQQAQLAQAVRQALKDAFPVTQSTKKKVKTK